MKAKEYHLIAKCVETGIMFGWNRAHKHTDEPDPETIRNAIEVAVMNEICEWFDFEDSYKDENT
jgi:hypothetical protein